MTTPMHTADTLPTEFSAVTDKELRRDCADLMNAIIEREVDALGGREPTEEDHKRILALAVAAAQRSIGSRSGNRKSPSRERLVAYLRATPPRQWDAAATLPAGMEIDGAPVYGDAARLATCCAVGADTVRRLWDRDWVVGPFVAVLYETTTHQGSRELKFTSEDLDAAERNAHDEWPLITINKEHDRLRGAFGVVDPRSIVRAGNALYGQLLLAPDFAPEFFAGRWLGLSPELAWVKSRQTGKAIGMAVTGLAVTNEPQLPKLRPRTAAVRMDVDDGHTDQVKPERLHGDTPMPMTKCPHCDKEIDTKALTAEQRKEVDELKASAAKQAVDLKAAGDAATAMQGERDELKARCDRLVAEKAALDAGKTGAEQTVAKLSADVTELRAGLAAVKAAAVAEKARLNAEREVDLIIAEGRADRAERDDLLDVRLGADVDERGKRIWDREVKRRKDTPARHGPMQGAIGRVDGPGQDKNPEVAWMTYRDQQPGTTAQEKHAAALRNAEGVTKYNAFLTAMDRFYEEVRA